MNSPHGLPEGLADVQQASRDLLEALRRPLSLIELPPGRLTDLVGRARASGVLGRLAARTERAAIVADLPARLGTHIRAALTQAQAHQRMTRFEIDRLQRALGPLVGQMVLLKGAAYVAADLFAASGRHSGDVDLLFPKDALPEVEARLLESGWLHAYTEEYTQNYYRQWMHELPPLRHAARLSVVDLHHTILPMTNRLRPDATALIRAAVPVASFPRTRILAPPDMVLHLCAHLAQDGDFNHSLREVLDLDDLLREFGTRPGFWIDLARHADHHQLGRPLYYAVTAAQDLLGTEIPEAMTTNLARWAPPGPIRRAMRHMVARTLAESGHSRVDATVAAYRQLLYMRSHWLRMPPGMLALHLARKTWMRLHERIRPTTT